MRTLVTGSASDVPESVAREIAAVGAVPSTVPMTPGDRIIIAGTPAVVLREITHTEFMVMVLAAGLRDAESFATMPKHLHFYAISVD